MINILLQPLVAITKAKKEKKLGNTLLVLFLSSVLLGISTLFITRSVVGPVWGLALLLILSFFVAIVIGSFLVHIILGILLGKKDFFNAITPIAYSSYIISAGVLVSSILALIPFDLGYALGSLLMLFVGAIGVSLLFKSLKEFYATDYFTVFLLWLLVYAVITIAALFLSLWIKAPQMILAFNPM